MREGVGGVRVEGVYLQRHGACHCVEGGGMGSKGWSMTRYKMISL